MRPLTPHDHLRHWMPHLLLLGMLLGMVWLLTTVLAPLRDPLILAAALTALTYPIIFEPLLRLLRRLLPSFNDQGLRQVTGILSTLLLITAIAMPMVTLLYGVLGTTPFRDLVSVFFHQDIAAKSRIIDTVMVQIQSLNGLYPGLGLEREAVVPWLTELLTVSGNFRHHFLVFLFAGGGGLLVSLVLAFLLLTNCYVQGGRAVLFLLNYTPLSPDQCHRLGLRYRQIVLRLLNDSVATALARGLTMGLIIWIGTGLNILLVACIGAFLSLVPVIGHTMVWLPLVALQWSGNRPGVAIVLGLGCLLVNVIISWARRRLGRVIDDDADWLGFMLFLGLLGGILAYGVKGFVIGPLIVVLTVLLARYFLPLYGIGEGEGLDASDEGDLPGLPPVGD